MGTHELEVRIVLGFICQDRVTCSACINLFAETFDKLSKLRADVHHVDICAPNFGYHIMLYFTILQNKRG